jgi:uncharacterized protein YndB with AHSA1/START domain
VSPLALLVDLSSLLVLVGLGILALAWVLTIQNHRSGELSERKVRRVNNLSVVALVLVVGSILLGFVPNQPVLAAIGAMVAVAWVATWLPSRWRTFHIVSEVEIAVPPEQVFACVSDFERWPWYVPGLEKIEVLTVPATGPGSRARLEQIVEGRVFHAEEEVTEFEPPHRLTSTLVSAARSNFGHYELDPTPSGTRVVYTFHTTMSPVDALLGGVLTRKASAEKSIRQRRIQLMGNLKELLESEPVLEAWD